MRNNDDLIKYVLKNYHTKNGKGCFIELDEFVKICQKFGMENWDYIEEHINFLESLYDYQIE